MGAPVGQRPRVGDDLLLVLHELRALRHLERDGQAGNGVVVRAALQAREHGLVDLRAQLLLVKDHACAGTDSLGFGWGTGDLIGSTLWLKQAK